MLMRSVNNFVDLGGTLMDVDESITEALRITKLTSTCDSSNSRNAFRSVFRKKGTITTL